jgi:1-acyl-sn-glycerol-3-phosphate acyltransferase
MIRWIKIIFKVLRYGIPMVFYVLFAYPRRDKISRMKRFKKLKYYLSHLHKDLDVKLIVTGIENIPNEQSFMITPNHQSLVDGSVMFEIFNDPLAFVSKGELTKVPVAKHLLGTMGSIFMKRDDLKEELRVMKRVRKSLLEDNIKWIIFPEGTRTKNENWALNDFKAGTYKFPMMINKKIIPCAIHGTGRLLNGKYDLKEYPIYVHFFKPFTKEDYKSLTTKEIAEKCQNIINEKLKEFIERDKKMIENQ